MTPKSEDRASRLVCLQEEDAKKALLNERMVIDIEPDHKDCHQGVLLSRSVAYQLIGNTQTFLFIGPEGQRLDQIPAAGLINWLEGA